MRSNYRSLRLGLASAACTLLAQSPTHAENVQNVGDWDISAAVLFYSEPDRVQASEPVINVRKLLDTDEYVNLKLTLDALTGASGSGATPTDQPQTYTRPSGGGDYTINENQIPLDDTFRDGRVALSATWNRPGWGGTQANWGFSFSNEYDYRSVGLSSVFTKNINNANTTLSGGLSIGSDEVSPVGGKPVEFASMAAKEETQARKGGDSSKELIDVIAGFTQIINSKSLFQLNYSLSNSKGYLNDPYKVITVVDQSSGRPLFENATEPDLPTVIHENRPDSRTKHSLYGQYKRYISGNVLDVSYRLMSDDWGVNSHTLDFKYRWRFGDVQFIQPHIRYYTQSAADFYKGFIVSGDQPAINDSSSYASSDYRLGAFNAFTVGLEFGQENPKNSWSVAAEYYLQTGDEPADKFGELSNQELYPDVEAIILRVLYDF